jgi:hypothetical protein
VGLRVPVRRADHALDQTISIERKSLFKVFLSREDIMSDTHKSGDHKRSQSRHVRPPHNRVVTTTTESGRLLDWVPIESQVPDGRVATPPPPSRTPEFARSAPPGPATTAPSPVSFELHDPNAERGPAGTVPVLRELAEHRRRVARRGADKKGFESRRRTGRTGDRKRTPSPFTLR